MYSFKGFQFKIVGKTSSETHPVKDAKWWGRLKTPDNHTLYTAISRKVVGKSARDNAERYCG